MAKTRSSVTSIDARESSGRRGLPSGNKVIQMTRPRDLSARRSVELELPEFLLRALESRVAEANEEASVNDQASLNDYIESELVNIITVRDVAELDYEFPGFADAVHDWLREMTEK
jgi:hypothetical protein